MRSAVHFIPIATTVVALFFAATVYSRYLDRRSGPHLLWWAGGILAFGAGTFVESAVTLAGWHVVLFKAWYITGALLGGAPLAQGTVYLLLKRRTANRMTMVLVPFFLIAATAVVFSPVNYELVETYRLTGSVIIWRWARMFSPFINTYAAAFLIGGAVVSAIRYRRRSDSYNRFVGNVFIAIGALLPGIGGTATRFGYTEVLYVTELIGLVLIWVGYRWNVRAPTPVAGNARSDAGALGNVVVAK
ncbi:MAG TPA: hypothetical protein VGA37_16910 [Gemmatimonadales bacterium]